MIKLQTREILRAAKRMGIQIRRGNPAVCALSIPAKIVGFNEAPNPDDRPALKTIANTLGVSVMSLDALEYGFEQADFSVRMKRNLTELRKHRSYKVGQNIAAKLGYKPTCTIDERHDRTWA